MNEQCKFCDGVLSNHGERCILFKPKEERWNPVPVTLGHPMTNIQIQIAAKANELFPVTDLSYITGRERKAFIDGATWMEEYLKQTNKL